MKIRLNKKEGFRITNPQIPVIITDSRGLVFYDNSNLIEPEKFNLPPGFDLNIESGNFRKLQSPVNFGKIPLEKPDRHKKQNPLNFRIIFNRNPAQVTVDWGQQCVFFDNSFKEKSIPEIYFSLFHECGHRFWDTGDLAEMNCDEYAVNQMLKFGFNPSQCGGAIIQVLNKPENIFRKENLINKILKSNGR